MRLSETVIAVVLGMSASAAFGQAPPADAGDGPYKVLNTAKVGGEGGFDYVTADPDSRHLYVVRSGQGGRISAYDMDTLKLAGEIPNVSGGHGVAVDPKTGHAFSSSSPVVMFDSKTLTVTKTIPVEGRPDGIFFEPSTARVYVLSHGAPHVTAINTADGTIAGTIDLGGAPEQGAADGKGHAYICVEDKGQVAVVDCKAMKTTAHYDLGANGGQPAGLSMDPANNVIFVYCRAAKNCLVLERRQWKNPRHPANRQRRRCGGVQSANYGIVLLVRRWQADGDQGNKPHQFCRGAECNHKVRGEMFDAGFQDGPDLSDHGRARRRAGGARGKAADKGGGRRGGRLCPVRLPFWLSESNSFARWYAQGLQRPHPARPAGEEDWPAKRKNV